MQTIELEDALGPPRIELLSVGLGTLAALAAGAIGAMFMLGCVFLFLSTARDSAPVIFPYMLGLVGFVALLLTLLIESKFIRMIIPEYGVRSGMQFLHIFSTNFSFYILMMPAYVIVGAVPERLMVVFAVQVLLASLANAIISGIISRYRYSLLSLYSGFFAVILTFSAILLIFSGASISEQILFLLAGLLILVTTLTTALRLLCEYLYSTWYQITGNDILGATFTSIIEEESAAEKAAEKALTQF